MEAPMVEVALSYAKKGWPVFPIHWAVDGKCSCGKPDCKNVAKHPMTEHGLKDASTVEPKIREWWEKWPMANIGIVTGAISGICVVDIDPRHGGDVSIDAVSVPDTVVVQTGGGGQHFYFKYDPRVTSHNGIFPGVDIKSDGGYVIAPPSVHASGKPYVWCDEELVKIANPPEWMFVEEKKKEPFNLPAKIGAGTRNDEIFKLARSLFSRNDLTLGEVLACCSTINQSRCEPPLDEAEVKGTVESAERYNEKDEPPPPVRTPPHRLVDFLTLDIPPVEYYVTDILQKKGKAMVSAAPNVGKSIFVQNIALDISCGSATFMDRFDVAPAKVLYLDLEMGESALKERFQKMVGSRLGGLENLYVKYIPDFDLLQADSKALIEGWLAEFKIEVLIIDPLGNAWSGDESKQELVGKLTAYLNTLIERFGIAILVVHHWRKATKDANTGGQMAAGSYKWSAWTDSHITLEGKPAGVTISCEKNRNKPRFNPFLAKLNLDTLDFEFITDFQKKFDESTLVHLFDGFGVDRVSIPDLIKRAKEQKILSETTLRDLVNKATSFEVDKTGKTHYLIRKGANDDLFKEEKIVLS